MIGIVIHGNAIERRQKWSDMERDHGQSLLLEASRHGQGVAAGVASGPIAIDVRIPSLHPRKSISASLRE